MLAAAPCQQLTSSLFFFFSPRIITDPFTPVFGPFAYKAAPLQVFLLVPRFGFMVCLSKCCFPSVQSVWNGLSWCCIVESPLLYLTHLLSHWLSIFRSPQWTSTLFTVLPYVLGFKLLNQNYNCFILFDLKADLRFLAFLNNTNYF